MDVGLALIIISIFAMGISWGVIYYLNETEDSIKKITRYKKPAQKKD